MVDPTDEVVDAVLAVFDEQDCGNVAVVSGDQAALARAVAGAVGEVLGRRLDERAERRLDASSHHAFQAAASDVRHACGTATPAREAPPQEDPAAVPEPYADDPTA